MFGIICTECRNLFTNRAITLLTLFGIPILYTILFGLLYSANVVKNIPLIMCDQDQTAISRIVSQAFSDSERYTIIAEVNTPEEVAEYLHQGNALAAVLIPAHFSRDIKMNRVTQVLIETNATNLMFANGILSSSMEIIQTLSVGTGQKLLEGSNQPPAQALTSVLPVSLSLRIMDNPTTSYSNFIMSGLTINGLQLAIFLVACTLLTAEYASLANRKDLSATTIILGKLLPCWLLAILSGMLSLALLIIFFKLPYHGHLFQLLFILSAFTFALSNFGLFISAAVPTVLSTMQGTAIYIMSAFLCCGYSWPLFAMNTFGKTYAALAPITYAATSIRDLLLAGHAPNLMRNSFILYIFGSIFLLLAILAFSIRRKQFEPLEETL